MQEGKHTAYDGPPSAIVVSMRRRTGRIGLLVTVLAGVLLAVTVFAVYAYRNAS